MATITSNAVTGNWTAGGSWVGGIPPGAGDAAVIVSGANITVDANTTVGSKASGVGAGITVNGGGTLTGTAGITLTVRGFDTTTNKAIQVAQNGNFTPVSMTVSVDAPSDWGTIINIAGNLTCVGTTFTIPSTNFVWSNTATHNVGTISSTPWDKVNSIYILKINTASNTDSGPISNAAGTGLGSFGNTSFLKVSGGFSGTIFNEVSSYANIAANGDYFMDYNKGVVYFKSSTNTLTLSYSYSFGTWFSYGITCQGNTTQSAVSITGNTVINYAGKSASQQSLENSHGGLMIDDKFTPAINAGRGLTLNGIKFIHCSRPLQVYNTNTSGTATTASNHLLVTNLTFTHCHFQGFGGTYSFSTGLINHGYTSFVDYTNLVFDSFAFIFTPLSRGTISNVNMSGCTGATTDGTGHVIIGQTIPHGSPAAQDCSFSNNGTGSGKIPTATLIGFAGANDPGSGLNDPCAFQEPGASGHPNVYNNNYLRCVHRVARLDSWMNVTNNYADRTYHHGIVHKASDGYISNYVCSGNVIVNSADASQAETAPSGGGWTLGYNRNQWIDNVIIEHNTFDGSNRSINFNDYENTVVLGTRLIIRNNVLSNSQQGMRLPAGNNTNVTSLALTQMDYNDDYANTTDPTNILQGTFVMGGTEYNSQGGRACLGCYIFNPNYTLPATANNLVLTVAGTAAAVPTGTKSIKVAWGGGAQVEFVAFQGVATSATNPAGGPATLTDTAQSFTITGALLKGYQVMIVSGTGSGQYGLIYTNTATVLTIRPNTASGAWAVTPDATSVYVVIKPHQTLTDTGTGTVFCGMHTPTLVTTNGTYTDSTITIAKNYPGTSGANNGVNPSYVSSSTGNFTPTNTALNGTASDGTYIGALPFLIVVTGVYLALQEAVKLASSISIAVQESMHYAVSGNVLNHETVKSLSATSILDQESSTVLSPSALLVQESLATPSVVCTTSQEAVAFASAALKSEHESTKAISLASICCQEALKQLSALVVTKQESQAAISSAVTMLQESAGNISRVLFSMQESNALLSALSIQNHEALLQVKTAYSTAHESLSKLSSLITQMQESLISTKASPLSEHEVVAVAAIISAGALLVEAMRIVQQALATSVNVVEQTCNASVAIKEQALAESVAIKE